jgi:CRISPR system Cascade subunit CasC
MLIQIHMLQNYSPSNLNRDDTGAPKDAFFGGVRRGRISSQCLKRSIRRSDIFATAFGSDNLLGVRTRRLPYLMQQELQKADIPENEKKAILERVPEIGRESRKAKKEEASIESSDEGEAEIAGEAVEEEESQVKQLIFVGMNEIKPLVQKLVDIYHAMGDKAWKKAKMADITKQLGTSLPKSVDIAMFGRMTTSDAFEDVSAAVQVAHAISTNALNQEFDYFTAVDDLANEPGAGMIGDLDFNSSTYYKYLNIHWEELVKNLGGDLEAARRAVVALLEAAATAQPTGKQNTFAAFNLPDLVLVEVSNKNVPTSYANAFLRSARPESDHSLMETSVRLLADYISKISKTYNLAPQRAYLSVNGDKLTSAEDKSTMQGLKSWLAEQLPAAG